MSFRIARGRLNRGRREVEVVQDIYDECGRDVIAQRSYGWHPECNVTHNGVDVDEIWINAQRISAGREE